MSKINWLRDYRTQTGCDLSSAMRAWDYMATRMAEDTKLRDAAAALATRTAEDTKLRDAAALAALQGLCANPNVMSDVGYESHVAARAIAMADAFLAARETGETD